MTTGEKIAALRRELGLSQEALADKLGLSRQAVSKWEADQAVPGMDNLVELSKLFGIPVDTLLRPNEPLPGKSGPAAEEPKVTIAPEGFSISYKPVLTKKTKWFVYALSALMAASVLCSVVSLIWLGEIQQQVDRLRAQVDAMPVGGATIYYPEPSVGESADDPIADRYVQYDLVYDPLAAVSEQLSLSIRAMPRELNAEQENAKFTIQSATSSWSCAAILEQDNAYTGTAQIPLRDGFSVYLTLTSRADGSVRNLLVENVVGVEETFALYLSPTWQDGGMTAGAAIGGTRIAGQIEVQIYGGAVESKVVPVSGRLVLRKGETELHSMPLRQGAQGNDADADGMTETLQYGAGDTCYAYAEPDWLVQDSMDDLTLEVEVTDNYGRTKAVPVW